MYYIDEECDSNRKQCRIQIPSFHPNRFTIIPKLKKNIGKKLSVFHVNCQICNPWIIFCVYAQTHVIYYLINRFFTVLEEDVPGGSCFSRKVKLIHPWCPPIVLKMGHFIQNIWKFLFPSFGNRKPYKSLSVVL